MAPPPPPPLDVTNGVNGDDCDDDSDIELQEVLFKSAQLCNYSLQKQEEEEESDFRPKKNPNDVKMKGVDTSCQFVKTNGSINCQNSKYEKGEPSCVHCTICNEPRPVSNDTMKRGRCGHVYCEECIIDYGRERIKESLTMVKCPVTDCKEKIVINDYFVPGDFKHQWRDAVREAKALASCYVIECPFLDCSGYLIDDKKGFFIRACPKCWTIFCVRCRDYWHMGIDCDTYQKIRSLPMLFSSIKDDDDDDEEDDD